MKYLRYVRIMQLFRMQNCFQIRDIFIRKEEVLPHIVDKFHSVQTLFIPTNFYDTWIHDSTIIALHSSAIPYSQYSWCEWRRVIDWLRVWLPPLFVVRSICPWMWTIDLSIAPSLSRVIGVSSVSNSGIDEYQRGRTLRKQPKLE